MYLCGSLSLGGSQDKPTLMASKLGRRDGFMMAQLNGLKLGFTR